MQTTNRAAHAEPVSVFPIAQATSTVFPDLYFRQVFLFFIEAGTKRVIDAEGNEMVAHAGDLLVLPQESIVTMENRPVMENNYRALGIAYSNESVLNVLSQQPGGTKPPIQHIHAHNHEPGMLVPHIKETLHQESLNNYLRTHRLMEPLYWLKHHGFSIPITIEESLLSRVRAIIEEDVSLPWTSGEVASQLAMSEPTMRRRLAKNGQGFAKILLNTRLEFGLSLLQTTTSSISMIAYDSGFKTPSHFADAFRKRFGISPKNIRERLD